MTVATDVAAQLTEDWAAIPALADLKVQSTERLVDDIQTPTALIRWKGFSKFAQAPRSRRNANLLLTIISPHQNADTAAEQLDAWAEAALDYLDVHYRTSPGDAEVVAWNRKLAVDIPLTVICEISTPESE